MVELLHQILNPPQYHVQLKLLALKEVSSVTKAAENQTENVVEIRVQVHMDVVDMDVVDMLDENTENHKKTSIEIELL